MFIGKPPEYIRDRRYESPYGARQLHVYYVDPELDRLRQELRELENNQEKRGLQRRINALKDCGYHTNKIIS